MGREKRLEKDPRGRAQEVLGQLHRQIGFHQLTDLIDEINNAGLLLRGVADILLALANLEDKDILGEGTFLLLADCIQKQLDDLQTFVKETHEGWHTMPTTSVGSEARWFLNSQGPAAFLARFEALVREGEERHRKVEQIARHVKIESEARIQAAARTTGGKDAASVR